MFEGRILQCSQGHSVCEGCVLKIHHHLKNECPQCRGAFVGTRNYILEEMVKQLKHLKASVMVKKTDTTRGGGSDSNANTLANDENSDNEDTDVVIDTAKLTKAMATLVASIPKPSKRETAAIVESCESPRPARASVTASPEPGELYFMILFGSIVWRPFFHHATIFLTHFSLSILGILWQPTPNGPPQPRGLFSCRILNCMEKLPVCRMLNHVRTFHISNLTEVRALSFGSLHYLCAEYFQFN